MPVPVDGSNSRQGVVSSSCYDNERPESIGEAEGPTPRGVDRHRLSSKMPVRPLAVLRVTNKRGRGIFGEHDERALVRLCTAMEALLRSKAAEVSLLWSGMAERCLIRESNSAGGGAGGAWSNHARVASTIMRLYSEASFPADAVALRRRRNERSAEGRRRSFSDGGVESNPSSDNGRKPSLVAIDDNDVVQVQRVVSETSELVDLSVNLFERSSEQLLSLVARFFRNMELMDAFQVCCWCCLRGFNSRGSAGCSRSCAAYCPARLLGKRGMLAPLAILSAHVEA